MSIFVGSHSFSKTSLLYIATDCSKAVFLCNSCLMLFDVGVSGRISYSIVGYLLAQQSRRLIGEALSKYIRRSSVRQHLIGCQGNIHGMLLKNHK